MIKRNALQFLGLGTALFLAVGCGSSDSSASATAGTTGAATTGTANEKPVEVAFVTNNASDYWTIARKGTEKATSELKGVTVDFVIPDDGQAATQRTKVADLLTKGVAGIAISPVDPKNEVDLINDAAKKTFVITQDSDVPDSDRACYIGSDNAAAGKMAADELIKALPNGGKVQVFVGKADAQNAKDRYQGFLDGLKGSKIQVLGLLTDDTDRVRAKANVSDTLVKVPDIAGLVGLWSYNGPAIYNAVKDANKVGKVKIVCFDQEPETIDGVKAGAIFATVVQQPFEFGYQSVKMMVAVARGDKSSVPANKLNIIPTQAIEAGNVEEYAKKLAEMTGKG